MRRHMLALAAFAWIAAGLPAPAAEFPAREITFVVPWGAGGSNDILARALQPLLKEQGVSVIIENVPGANGSIGIRRVATAEPDGYTIGMNTSSTLALIAQNRVPLKNEQLTNIARVSIEDPMLIVQGAGPYKSLEQFLQHMKDNPGKVSIASPGTYNVNHIFAAMTARAAGVDYILVPYTGGAKIMADLTAGQIDATVLKALESLGQITAGLARPIGVFANQRLRDFPDVPTFKEKGHDVFPYGPVVQMAYVVGPAGLPPAVRDKLIAVFRKALADPRFQEFAKKNAFRVDDLTGDALTEEVRKNGEAIAAVAKSTFKPN